MRKFEYGNLVKRVLDTLQRRRHLHRMRNEEKRQRKGFSGKFFLADIRFWSKLWQRQSINSYLIFVTNITNEMCGEFFHVEKFQISMRDKFSTCGVIKNIAI